MEQQRASLWKGNLSFSQKLIRSPLYLIPPGTRVSVLGGVNKGRSWIVGSSGLSCWVGNYEVEKQRLLEQSVRRGTVVWDIGANVGFYTLAFASRVGLEGRVFAFEPLASNVAFLRRHVTENGLSQVTIVQAALSDKSGLISFCVGSDAAMGRIVSNQTTYLIPAITMDEFAGPNPAPHIIKMDVEGAEASVLAGGLNLLTNHKPELWIALHGAQAKVDCSQILRKLGYSIYDLLGNRLNEPLNADEIVART